MEVTRFSHQRVEVTGVSHQRVKVTGVSHQSVKVTGVNHQRMEVTGVRYHIGSLTLTYTRGHLEIIINQDIVFNVLLYSISLLTHCD